MYLRPRSEGKKTQRTEDLLASGEAASTMRQSEIEHLLPSVTSSAAFLWQVSNPTPSLAERYRQVPEWSRVAYDCEPRLRLIARATAIGLVASRVEG